MAKRTYNVKGTQDFLVLAVIFFFLCLWAIKDAWYPSPKVLERHPLQIELAFEMAGAIGKLHVMEGDAVGENMVVAELRSVKLEGEFAAAKKEYSDARKKVRLMESAVKNAEKNGASDEGIAGFKKNLADANAAMQAAHEKVNTLKEQLAKGELVAGTKGEVKSLNKSLHGQVEAGETVMVIDPKDHFYTFNKSLAIFSFIAFWVFICLHVLAR
jgi:multidrug resistance efflux pump